jgi:hypothetical protein
MQVAVRMAWASGAAEVPGADRIVEGAGRGVKPRSGIEAIGPATPRGHDRIGEDRAERRDVAAGPPSGDEFG